MPLVPKLELDQEVQVRKEAEAELEKVEAELEKVTEELTKARARKEAEAELELEKVTKVPVPLVPKLELDQEVRARKEAEAELEKAEAELGKMIRELAEARKAESLKGDPAAVNLRDPGPEIALLLLLEQEVRKVEHPMTYHLYSPDELQWILDRLSILRCPPCEAAGPKEPAGTERSVRPDGPTSGSDVRRGERYSNPRSSA
jgi:hypothetical protein